MRLIHYSQEPVTFLFDRDSFDTRADALEGNPPFKPRGLWVSDEDDFGWRQWCKQETFGEKYAWSQEVTLKSNALVTVRQAIEDEPLDVVGGVLHISDEWEFDAFCNAYELPPEPGHLQGELGRMINWGLVMDHWDGVLITPYLWSRRLDPLWYYTIDCASGCIWHPTDVVEKLGDPMPVTWNEDEE